jgi:hypothetical protein
MGTLQTPEQHPLMNNFMRLLSTMIKFLLPNLIDFFAVPTGSNLIMSIFGLNKKEHEYLILKILLYYVPIII